MITFYLIRHAESQGNVNNHLIGGRSNHLPLTERGILQAQLLGERLSRENFHFDQVYCSTAVRTRHTASLACEPLAYPNENIIYSEQILELSQGEWEGKVRKEIYTPEKLMEIRANSLHFKAPGGESPSDVEERMYTFLDSITQDLSEDKDHSIGIFSHGFAIKALFRKIMNSDPTMSWRTIIHNTSLTGLEYRKGFWFAERLNDHTHLNGTEFIGHYG